MAFIKQLNRIFYAHLSLLCLLLFFTLSATKVQAESLRFATHTTPPLSNYISDLLTQALAEKKITTEVSPLPGKRVIHLVNSGQFDGDASRIFDFKNISNDPVENYIRVDEGIYKVQVILLTHKDSPIKQASWAKANLGPVTYIRGSKNIRKHINENNRVPATNVRQALTLVAHKRADSAILFKAATLDTLKKHPELSKDLKIHPPNIDEYWLYPFLHKDKSSYIKVVAEQLKKKKNDGTSQTLLKKHGLIQ
ncbi:exported hypothetical protein [Candidatus Terasakiella magnetica]|uniref:Uncharacterized protein n=1 Tax=Candidatus Terasakiella magnetica TaxID=1867952 RepID=A0A1C3RM09_9PROT|nr:transporter substrate-binding domain-containing protein [Candidatus Terasakiella magnetica]SCA58306.1 exported hypothetical protein [Candidatus Terasakiella magnetica]